MDISSVLQQVIGAVAENPETLSSMAEHPYSTIGNITNNENVSKEEASQVVTALSSLAGGNDIDLGSIASMAAGLLGENGNSVHSLASALLGSGSDQGVDVTSGNIADIASSLLGTAQNSSSGLDLSSIIGLITKFFGK